MIAWLNEKGVEGARVLARHVAPPFIGSNGPELNPVTAYLMENFETMNGYMLLSLLAYIAEECSRERFRTGCREALRSQNSF